MEKGLGQEAIKYFILNLILQNDSIHADKTIFPKIDSQNEAKHMTHPFL